MLDLAEGESGELLIALPGSELGADGGELPRGFHLLRLELDEDLRRAHANSVSIPGEASAGMCLADLSDVVCHLERVRSGSERTPEMSTWTNSKAERDVGSLFFPRNRRR